jgi:hypothetical protein
MLLVVRRPLTLLPSVEDRQGFVKSERAVLNDHFAGV